MNEQFLSVLENMKKALQFSYITSIPDIDYSALLEDSGEVDLSDVVPPGIEEFKELVWPEGVPVVHEKILEYFKENKFEQTGKERPIGMSRKSFAEYKGTLQGFDFFVYIPTPEVLQEDGVIYLRFISNTTD